MYKSQDKSRVKKYYVKKKTFNDNYSFTDIGRDRYTFKGNVL